MSRDEVETNSKKVDPITLCSTIVFFPFPFLSFKNFLKEKVSFKPMRLAVWFVKKTSLCATWSIQNVNSVFGKKNVQFIGIYKSSNVRENKMRFF